METKDTTQEQVKGFEELTGFNPEIFKGGPYEFSPDQLELLNKVHEFFKVADRKKINLLHFLVDQAHKEIESKDMPEKPEIPPLHLISKGDTIAEVRLVDYIDELNLTVRPFLKAVYSFLSAFNESDVLDEGDVSNFSQLAFSTIEQWDHLDKAIWEHNRALKKANRRAPGIEN